MSVKVGVKLDTGKARNIWQITTGALMLVKIYKLMAAKIGGSHGKKERFHVRKKGKTFQV